ncbi:MAG: LamG domain-containing protein [Hadesarchaea archaeon]|nr:LamG domain-containing protein [Hadesarchaea archaeon]
MEGGPNAGRKSKTIKVTPSDRRPVLGRGFPSHLTTPGRLKLIAASFIFAFLLSSFPLGAADRGGFTFVLIKELSVEVVDNETGAPVDNVEIWGEIHSTTLYFKMTLNGDRYSYRISDDPGFKNILKEEIDKPRVCGRYVLEELSELLEPGEHTYRMTASAPGYADRTVEGTFVAGEQTIVNIELGKGSGGSSLTLDLTESGGTITRSRQEKTETRWGDPVYYSSSQQLTEDDPGFEARLAELRNDPDKDPIVTEFTVGGEAYYEYQELIGYDVQVPVYRTEEVSLPASASWLTLLAYVLRGYSITANSETRTDTKQLSASAGEWRDTGETCWRWFYEGDPTAEAGYRWVYTGSGLLWLTKNFKKQYNEVEYYRAQGYSVTANYTTESYQSWEQTGTRTETVSLSASSSWLTLLIYRVAGYTVTANYTTESYQSWEQTGTESYQEWVPGHYETRTKTEVYQSYEAIGGHWEWRWFGFIPYPVWVTDYGWVERTREVSYQEWVPGQYVTKTRDVYGWVERTRTVLSGYTASKEVPTYGWVERTRQVLTGYTATKEVRELIGYTATKQVIDYENTYVSLDDPKLEEYTSSGYSMEGRYETRRVSLQEYGANPGAYPGAENKYGPPVSKRRLVGYRQLETVRVPGDWRSVPEFVESEVVVRGHGEVGLSLDVPRGIGSSLLPASGGEGDLGVEVSGSGVEIKGEVSGGSSPKLTLQVWSEARARLRVWVSSSDHMVGRYTITVRASDGKGNSDTKTFTLSVGQLGDGNFEISLGKEEVALVQGQASVGVALQSTSRGFNGHVELSVEGLPSGVQASFDANPVYLASAASAVLTLRLNGPPSQVKNTVTVVARDLNGQPKASRSFTLYAFEVGDLGRMVLNGAPPYRADLSGSSFLCADWGVRIPDPDHGLALAWTSSGPPVGSAGAAAMQFTSFRADHSNFGVTAEARLRVRSFIINQSVLLGGSHGKAAIKLQVGNESRETTVDESWDVDVVLLSKIKLLNIGRIYNTIKNIQTASELISLTETTLNWLNDYYKSYEIKTSLNQVNEDQWYNVGAGLTSSSASALLAGSMTVVVGYVDSIKVWNGTAPAIELKFNESIYSDGLTSRAANFLGSGGYERDLNITSPSWYKGEGDASLEAWVKFRDLRNASIVSLERAGCIHVNWEELWYYEGVLNLKMLPILRNRFVFDRRPGTLGVVSGGACETNKWYHLVGVYRRGEFSLYVDGELVAGPRSGGWYTLGPEDANRIFIGCNSFGYGLNGLIEEVNVYDMALSASEIAARWRAGPSP